MPEKPASVFIAATIITDPVIQKATYGRVKTTFTAKAENIIYVRNNNISVCGLINVISFDSRDSALEYGDSIIIKGILNRPGGLVNPGLFDYQQYLNRQGIYAVITVTKGGFVSVLRKNEANRFIKNIFRVRHKLRELINKYLPAQEAGILTGVLLGDRSDIDKNLNDRFIKTGTVHILAISGMNVGFIAAIFIMLMGFLRLPRMFIYLISCVLLIAYAVLTGANISVIRATIMVSALLIGLAFSRRVDILNCLGLSGIIILLKNPSAIFDPGFQLSFAAVISIIIFVPQFEKIFLPFGKTYQPIKYLIDSITVSLAAWLGIIPIIAYHFNIISPICIAANIPVVLLSFLITAGGLAFLAAALVWPFLADIFAAGAGFITGAMIKTVNIFSNVPFGFFWTHKWSALEIIAFYAGLGIFALSLHQRNFKKIYVVIAGLVFFNITIWQSVIQTTNYKLQITVLDVGHGDAAVIEFPGGGCALVDAGKANENMDMGEDVVTPYLLGRRINTVDALFVTHPDDDHYGGAASILKNFNVRYVFDNGDKDIYSKNFFNYQGIIQVKHIPHRALKRGDRISGFKDSEILVFNPSAEHISQTGLERNNNSLVLKVTSGSASFMFCADIRQEAMGELAAHGLALKSDCIKIAHHGGALGEGGENFIKSVSPKVALISAAQKDVSEELLNKLDSIDCKVYQTCDNGAIVVSSSRQRSGALSAGGEGKWQVGSTAAEGGEHTHLPFSHD